MIPRGCGNLARGLVVPVALMATLGLAGGALASGHMWWDQDFSDNTDGWLDKDSGWSGTITRNAADETATVTETNTGPFSRFDGYRAEWPGEYVAEIDVHLDPAWETGTGFDYAVASNGSDNAHQRDFLFHVGVVDGLGLLVNGSNNADFTTNPFKLVNDNGGNYHTVTTAGWYTLQHVFRDDGGVLAVDLNLLDADGNTLWTATRSAGADTIGAGGEVGGNRYAWFTHIEVPGGLEIDNHQLYLVLLEPQTKDDCKKGGFADFGFQNQGQCIASVVANEAAGR